MVGRKTRSRCDRRYLAAITCVLWLLGVEVLPNLHLAFHDDHHSHAADGTIVHDAPATADDHDHGDAADHDADRSPGPGDQLAIDHHRTGHAAAGIAHHAIALHRPAPPLLEPLFVLRATWRIEDALADQLSHAPLARPTARGPPATA